LYECRIEKVWIPIHNYEKYYSFVGNGLLELVERALPDDTHEKEIISNCMIEFEKQYSVHWKDETLPYDGIIDMLEKLNQKGIPMGILSNKPHKFTIEMASYFFNDKYFNIVQGIEDGVVPKPNPNCCINMIKKMNHNPENFIFVGDSDTDILAAKSANMLPIGVSWGFQSSKKLIKYGATIIVNKPYEILKYV
jgi:phosphoglycolate phosphatase